MERPRDERPTGPRGVSLAEHRTNTGAMTPAVLAASLPPVRAGVSFGGDALLADLFGDRHLLGHRLGLEPHPLLGHYALLHVHLFFVQHDLVFLARQLRPR